MSEQAGGYGYVDDESEIGSSGGLNFGLNQGITLSKFEYITNGGKDGAEAEALDIVFTINGVDKGYRKFPITKAFIKGTQEETTDPASAEMKDSFKDLNAVITHVMHCFVSREDLTIALSVPLTGFKQFCQILMGLLPKNFSEIKLDLFAQYQWQFSGENTKTFLEIPKKMKQGKWLCPSVPAIDADGKPDLWRENRIENPNDNVTTALYYTDGAGNMHPFTRNGWFMNSNFATQQKEVDDTPPMQNAAMQPGSADPAQTAKVW